MKDRIKVLVTGVVLAFMAIVGVLVLVKSGPVPIDTVASVSPEPIPFYPCTGNKCP